MNLSHGRRSARLGPRDPRRLARATTTKNERNRFYGFWPSRTTGEKRDFRLKIENTRGRFLVFSNGRSAISAIFAAASYARAPISARINCAVGLNFIARLFVKLFIVIIGDGANDRFYRQAFVLSIEIVFIAAILIYRQLIRNIEHIFNKYF